jgi:hypothetical protein
MQSWKSEVELVTGRALEPKVLIGNTVMPPAACRMTMLVFLEDRQEGKVLRLEQVVVRLVPWLPEGQVDFHTCPPLVEIEEVAHPSLRFLPQHHRLLDRKVMAVVCLGVHLLAERDGDEPVVVVQVEVFWRLPFRRHLRKIPNPPVGFDVEYLLTFFKSATREQSRSPLSINP